MMMEQLIATWRKATAAYEAYGSDVLKPAEDAADAECATIPHVTTTASYATCGGTRRHMSTSDRIAVCTARSWLAAAAKGEIKSLSAESLDTCRELIAAADARDAEVDAVRHKWRLGELNQHLAELVNAAVDASDATMKHPAASLHDVLTKIDLADQHGISLNEIETEIKADLRRLAGETA